MQQGMSDVVVPRKKGMKNGKEELKSSLSRCDVPSEAEDDYTPQQPTPRKRSHEPVQEGHQVEDLDQIQAPFVPGTPLHLYGPSSSRTS